MKYWNQPKRHNIALYTAGYLYKNGVPKNLACELMEHIINIAGLSDDSISKTLRLIEETYVKDLKTESVGGYTYLLKQVDGDESVIATINHEFGKLGYHFSGNDRIRTKNENGDYEQPEETSNMATTLLNIIESKIAELFKDQLNNSFAAIWINGHIETIPIPEEVDLCKIHYFKGGCLLRGGKFNEAISCFDKALAINPNDTNALLDRGATLFFNLSKSEEAMLDFQRLLSINPNDIDAWVHKGMLHYALGEYSEAVDCYDHALKIDSNMGEIWYSKGEALLRIDKSDDAQYCFDKAKELGVKSDPFRDT